MMKQQQKMENITKGSLKEISKRAGIKLLSEDCYDVIRNLLEEKIKEVIENSLILMEESKLKTVNCNNIYNSLELMNEAVTESK